MKSAAVFLLIFVLINIVYSNELSQYQDDHPSSGEPSKLNLANKTLEPEENWFEQKLDHFNTINEYIIWKQNISMLKTYYLLLEKKS
ncbi:unnamed protein product [Ceratitis capitata]|uniref:(Mediterranean fruit fly) hypothetical protein n=1 Tax=Ceratitis capitata TaxID=7213 RepID=A0A811UT19_CERCA|nr:unnamed protein product [Ceratitis capitata]